jgi:hypothetical protein
MKTRFSLIFFIFFTFYSTALKSNVHLQNTSQIQVDTLVINSQYYIQILKDNRFNCLLSIKGDTIVKSEDYYFKVEFLDINEDGYKDIRVFVISNTPNQCDNYLFDLNLKIFKVIHDCLLDLKKIKGTDFFYTYNRAGCSDSNWESYLGKIENYKFINYGYIYGQGCDYETKDNLQVINIYEVDNSFNDEKKLIKKLPYQKYIKQFDEKWDFIVNYWTNNYKIFER